MVKHTTNASLYKTLGLIFFIFFAYAYYIWLRLEHIQAIRSPREFYDTVEYLWISSQPLFSSDFWIAIRPPLLPLFYKIFSGKSNQIMLAQAWVSIFSWGVLALLVSLVIKNYWLKFPAFIILLSFSLVQNIILWDALIISESISLSLLALFTATGLWLVDDWKNYKYVLFLVISILLAFVRDTYAYFILICGISVLGFVFFVKKRIQVLTISGTFILLFLIVNVISALGMRWYTPFLMTVGLRILPNQEYVEYFELRGMPLSDELMLRAGKPIQEDNIAMLYDPQLEDFREWVRKNGRQEFIRFLWFFKVDTLQNPLRQVDYVFNPDLYYYAATGYEPIITNQRFNELLYPFRFGIIAAFVYNAIALLLVIPAIHYRKILWGIPLILILLSYPQAVLIWNADAYEIARHSLHHNIMFRLGFLILTLLFIDFLIQQKLFLKRILI